MGGRLGVELCLLAGWILRTVGLGGGEMGKDGRGDLSRWG